MPSLLRHRVCPACGSGHNFCLPHGEIARGQRFDFRCPHKDRAAQLQADAPGEPSRFYMQGAVELVEIVSGPRRRTSFPPSMCEDES